MKLINFRMCAIAGMLLLVICVFVGCAQNTEPAGKMIQSNRGPNTPQDTKIIYNIVAGDYYATPTSQPAGATEAGDVAAAETGLFAKANPATGLATAQGPRRGRNHNVSIWTDASAAASPNVGSMNPSASQTQTATPTQDVKPNINPSVAFGMPGSAVTSSASGTQGNGSGPTTGAPNTVSPAQSPWYAAFSGLSSSDLLSAWQQLSQLVMQRLGATATPSTQAAESP